VLQHFGHRRLRDVQQLRGGADGAGLADGLEDLDMTQAHGGSITFVYGEHLYSLFAACHLALTSAS
jgi:hypothetical protein